MTATITVNGVNNMHGIIWTAKCQNRPKVVAVWATQQNQYNKQPPVPRMAKYSDLK